MFRILLLVALSLPLVAVPTATAKPFWQEDGNVAAPAPDSPIRWNTFSELAERLRPAVVNISTTETVRHPGMPGMRHPGNPNDPFEEFFRRFFEGPGMRGMPPREFQRKSLGSGFIVSREGYIVTNNHVVENADEVTVRLNNEHEFEAEVIGRDPKTDLALVKIDAHEKLFAVPLGDSDTLHVGEWVMAIGNPFGLSHTVTQGIVSAKGRVIGAGPYDNFIQTDASINPGNSGGPLFNIRGEVVGINTAIIAGGTGIGFAVPVNMAKEVMQQLKEHGKVTRGWIGVYIQEITDDLEESLELKDRNGALVADVVEDSPAEKAGVKRSDVIVGFNGRPITKMEELPRAVAATPVGKKVDLEVIRDGRSKTLEIEVGLLKEEEEGTPGQTTSEDFGMVLQKITPQLADSMNLEESAGLLVSDIERGGPAWEAGIRRGDIILEVNRKTVSDMEDFRKAIKSRDKERATLFLVKRSGNTLFFGVKP
ncbi:MAG: DegQ family serine endoprotease [Nitrospirota bacterium]|jgi:serine protease Do